MQDGCILLSFDTLISSKIEVLQYVSYGIFKVSHLRWLPNRTFHWSLLDQVSKNQFSKVLKNIHDLWKLPNGLFLEKNSQIQCYV